MSPRPRLPVNRKLPEGWRWKNGAYRYRVPAGQEEHWDNKSEFKLGATEAAAYAKWARRIQVTGFGTITTIGQGLQRYLVEVVPTKAARTQVDNRDSIPRLIAVFGAMNIVDFKPTHAYAYRDKMSKRSLVMANHDLEVLSHAFTKFIEWGLREDHPMIEGRFKKIKSPPRTRLVEEWEVQCVLGLKPTTRRDDGVRVVQAYIRLKRLTSKRMTELLRLRAADGKPDGLHITLTKTAKKTGITRQIINWTPDLRQAWKDVLAARPVDISPWAFCTKAGESYLNDDGKCPGFSSMWQRAMAKALKVGGLKERFMERDLRAETLTRVETIEKAQALASHTDRRTTAEIYRRKPERVDPAG